MISTEETVTAKEKTIMVARVTKVILATAPFDYSGNKMMQSC